MTDSTGKVVEDLTCDEAKKTEDQKLIDEFCPAEEPSRSEKPKADPVEEVVEKADKTVKQTQETVERTISPDKPDDEPEGEDEAPTQPTDVVPGGGGGGGTGGGTGGDGGGNDGGRTDGAGSGSGTQFSTAGESPRGIEAGPDQHSTNTSARPADSAGYSTGGFGSGYSSQSALTLQPFAAPLVSVPPVYEFPQIAEQLLTGDEPVAAAQPILAPDGTVITPSTTAVNSYSNGATGTPADPTGWLAATATGLIMLVGAAHALNGGRTPRRAEA